jgi:RNA polymerase sigma-70 factor (ECF subfamily)
MDGMSEPLDAAEHAAFIARIRAGDEQAAAELVRRYEPEIRLEVRTWLRLRDPRLRRVFDSMDVCQSVLANFFLRVAAGDFDLGRPEQLAAVLAGIARNKLSEHVRHHQRQRRDVRRVEAAGPEAVEVPVVETPSQWVAGKELLAEFRRRLSDDERKLADLRADGQDWAAVAAAVGGTSEGCRKQLSRAVERIERELGLVAEAAG